MTGADGLDGRHRDTLGRLFAHPAPHNLQWHDVESLLRRLGRVEARHDERLAVTVAGRTVVFAERHRRDVSADDLVRLRHLLAEAGVEPAV